MLRVSKSFSVVRITLLLIMSMLFLQCHCGNQPTTKQKRKPTTSQPPEDNRKEGQSSKSTASTSGTSNGKVPPELNKPSDTTNNKGQDSAESPSAVSSKDAKANADELPKLPHQAAGRGIKAPQVAPPPLEQMIFYPQDGYQIQFTDSTCTEAIVKVSPSSSSPSKEFRLPVRKDPPNMDTQSLQSYAAWTQQHMQVYLPKSGSQEEGYVLVKRGGRKNPLHILASEGAFDTIEKWINSGEVSQEDINAVDEKGFTPLQTAVEYGHLDIVRYFIEKLHVKVDTYQDLGANILHSAAAHGHLNIVKYLLEENKTIPIDSQGRKLGFTALHVAIFYTHHIGIVKYLLGQGANIETKDNEGNTPLHVAMQKGHLDIVLALIQAKANIEAKNNVGDTPLHIAMQKGHTAVVLALVKAGADLHALNNAGQSPIEVAFAHKNPDLIKQVFQEIYINAQGNDGLTHLDRATKHSDESLAALLVQLGAT